jgi:sigma54-dependent transcription regulator
MKNKQLGVFMDHSTAILMDISGILIGQSYIESKFSKQEKQKSMQKGESSVYTKEQAFQSAYYKEIGNAIKKYNEVLLFGPTDAKSELHNLIKEDHLFDSIKIDVQDSKKLSGEDMRNMVRKHFKIAEAGKKN